MKTAIAFGTFDGLHAGHRAVLNATEDYKRVAVTFNFPPKFADKSGGCLMTLGDRLKGLKALGMDEIECLDFESFKDMSAEDFLSYIKARYDVGLISCGYDFRFGRGALGNVKTLEDFCLENKIKLAVVPAVKSGEEVISSSMIRELISKGDIKKANEFLYYPYGFTASVIKGDMRGRTIGIRTANQVIPSELITPKCGVYKSSVYIDGKCYKAVSNIGYRPTYKTENITSETHILGFSGDIYGKKITVCPERFLRKEKKFSSLDELKKAINNDILEVTK